jgi:hypothetical protein
LTNFVIANKAFKDSRKMDLGALAWVERSNKIVKETFASCTCDFFEYSRGLVVFFGGRSWVVAY